MTSKNDTSIELPASALSIGDFNIETLRKVFDDAGSDLRVIDIGEALSGVPPKIPVLLDRNQGRVMSIKATVDEYRRRPERKTGTAVVNTLESFIDLTDRHRTADSVIFADTDWRNPSLTTIVDYHEARSAGDPDNGRHRIHYPFPLSEEWKAWIKQDGEPMSQEAFAEWIEDHLPELSSPGTDEVEDFGQKFGLKVAYPNEMVALSRGLKIHVESRIKNNVTLQTGEGEITWDEEHKDAAGNKITVPGLFILSIPPFFMGETTRIPVRLRYRVAAGNVRWFFKLYRPDVYITQQIERDLLTAATATELPHFRGKPEMSA